MNKIINKKGISVVLSYVVLIMIVIILAGMTYTWLKFRIPKEIPKCPDDISIIIKNYCYVEEEIGEEDDYEYLLTVIFQNKGLFNIDGILIRYGDDVDDPAMNSFEMKNEAGAWIESPYMELETAPGETKTVKGLKYSEDDEEDIEKIELTPFIYKEGSKEIILCEDAMISEEITDYKECS